MVQNPPTTAGVSSTPSCQVPSTVIRGRRRATSGRAGASSSRARCPPLRARRAAIPPDRGASSTSPGARGSMVAGGPSWAWLQRTTMGSAVYLINRRRCSQPPGRRPVAKRRPSMRRSQTGPDRRTRSQPPMTNNAREAGSDDRPDRGQQRSPVPAATVPVVEDLQLQTLIVRVLGDLKVQHPVDGPHLQVEWAQQLLAPRLRRGTLGHDRFGAEVRHRQPPPNY